MVNATYLFVWNDIKTKSIIISCIKFLDFLSCIKAKGDVTIYK